MVMQNYILDTFKDYKTLHRQKRSVLPITGKAMNFLFGTITESDLSSIKNNVRTLSENQKQISHILAENISILNVTRLEVSQNRQAINKLTKDVHSIDLKLKNITETIEEQVKVLEKFVQLNVQLDLITGELRLLIQKAMFYIEHI